MAIDRTSSSLIQLGVLLLVFLLYTCTALASGRETLPQQKYYNDNGNREVIRAELLHRDHPDSPLSPPGTLSLYERLEAAVNRDMFRRSLRARRLAGADDQTPVVLSEFVGEYVMTLDIGTPPQKFTGVIDTGSDLVWVQCAPCITCFAEPDPFFVPTNSSTFVILPCTAPQCSPTYALSGISCDPNCHFGYSYLDGSGIHGDLANDTITLTNSTPGASPVIPNFMFGCMDNDTGQFSNVDGIFGFSRGLLSLPSQLLSNNFFDEFAYCLIPYNATTTLPSPLFFGYTTLANTLISGNTSILNYIGQTVYFVNMTGIVMNGSTLSIPPVSFERNATSQTGGVIIDSGTILTYFVSDILDIVVETLSSLINYPPVNASIFGLPLCYNVSGIPTPDFPTISFLFNGLDNLTTTYDLYSYNTFTPVNNSTTVDIFCLAMLPNLPAASNMIIGNIAQGNHYIQFDASDGNIAWINAIDCGNLPF